MKTIMSEGPWLEKVIVVYMKASVPVVPMPVWPIGKQDKQIRAIR